ncbi:MAG: glycosyltransferase family 4 protein [Ktedonobacteraceae bacterium]
MAKTRKVLMLVENVPAPADRRVWPEAIVLRDNGYQVSIISPKGTTNQHESYICIDGIHIYRYRLPTLEKKYIGHIVEYSVALLMTFCLSIKVFFQRGFDVIHTANPPDIFFLIGLFYRLLGKKFVFDQHDLSPELFQVIFKKRAQWLYKVMRFFEKCSYKVANVVITSNESQKRFAIERGHCQPGRVFVVRNGPNLQEWKAVEPNLQLKDGRPFLLGYIGIMGVQDGVEYTLYALHELIYKRGRQDVSLALIGQGSSFKTLRSLACELKIDAYTHFTGIVPHEEVPRYLAAIDIGLIPDPQNGVNEFSTMLKTMDYMAARKPILAFDLAETRFTAQEAALYAKPNVIEDFADKIEQLLADEEMRTRLGEFGRRRLEEELSWEHTSKNLMYAYNMLFP